MNTNIQSRKDKVLNFINRVDSLFSEIKQWVINTDLVVSSSEITIEEEESGLYSLYKLILKNKDNREIAQIIPIGCSVLGANGRVDIKGLYDSEIILDFNKGGPKMIRLIRDENGKEIGKKVHHYYRGIDQDGWYWVENKRDKGHLLNAELFFDLLSEISDYESN